MPLRYVGEWGLTHAGQAVDHRLNDSRSDPKLAGNPVEREWLRKAQSLLTSVDGSPVKVGGELLLLLLS